MAYVLLALILVGVWLFCLFDILATDEPDVRLLPKFVWFLVVLLGFMVGSALWLLLGRPRRAPGTSSNAAWPSPPGFGGAGKEGPKGPDDDPDFLNNLDRKLRGDD